jgi:hypothetical protein
MSLSDFIRTSSVGFWHSAVQNCIPSGTAAADAQTANAGPMILRQAPRHLDDRQHLQNFAGWATEPMVQDQAKI